jgi:hypothetical protein
MWREWEAPAHSEGLHVQSIAPVTKGKRLMEDCPCSPTVTDEKAIPALGARSRHHPTTMSDTFLHPQINEEDQI